MKPCGDDFIHKLQNLLSHRERRVIHHPSFSRAAVLVPLFKKGDDCHLLFTKRTEHVKYHKGEISFPGGMVDEEDSNLEETALREAFEEIGLKEDDIRVFGALDDIVTITEFIVTPVVGFFPHPYPFKISEVEIAELIEVPVASLLDSENFREREIRHGGDRDIVCAYQHGAHVIWGATARILQQFLELIFLPHSSPGKKDE